MTNETSSQGRQEEEFKSSTPHLEPNLSRTQYDAAYRQTHDYGQLRYANNEVGDEASALRGRLAGESEHREGLQYPDGHSHLAAVEKARAGEVEEISKQAAEYDAMIEKLRSKRRTAIEQIAVDTAISVLAAERDSLGLKEAREDLGKATTAVEANLYRSQKHFRDNEEAYKNQAVNEYNARRDAMPNSYPEPLNYPGYTDQAQPGHGAPEQSVD